MNELLLEKLREDYYEDMRHSKPDYTHNLNNKPWEFVDYDEDEDCEDEE